MLKRVLLANDLPGIGKVALMAAIPVMNAAKVEIGVLPTVILSSHSEYKDFYAENYDRGSTKFIEHWKSLGIKFDGVVTGYVKEESQVDALIDFSAQNGGFLISDPIMADSGKFYSGFDYDYLHIMKKMCAAADIVVPNITEACFLTKTEYIASGYSLDYIESLAKKMTDLGSKACVITGVDIDGKIGALSYISERCDFGDVGYSFYAGNKFAQRFIGTGDLFTTALSACVVRGAELIESIKLTVDWIAEVLEYTMGCTEKDLMYGVYFEPCLSSLIDKVDELFNK